MRKTVIRATSGKTLSTEYTKCALFDYICEQDPFIFDGISGEELIAKIEQLRPMFDVDDVIVYAYDMDVDLNTAAEALLDQYEQM